MPLSALLNRPCTIIRRTPSVTHDIYGNDVPTESTVDTVCEIQQTQRTEPPTAAELGVTTYDVWLPIGTALGTGDALVVAGREYELIGDPWVADSGSAAVHHVAATVRRTAGEGPGS